jgi:ERF superfamily
MGEIGMETTTELTIPAAGAVVTYQDEFLVFLERAAKDPNIDTDKLAQLIGLKERVEAKNAEREFNLSMIAAQAEVRPVWRDAENKSNNSRYARFESLDNAIRPIYTKHGFALCFGESENLPRVAGNIRMRCTVRHQGGHSENYEFEGAPDVAGPQGKATKTPIQGAGSTNSYIRRYLVANVFNVAFQNEDNDGNNRCLTEEQITQVYDMVNACELTPNGLKAFLRLAGFARIEDIQQHRFEDLLQALKDKLRAKEGR